MEFHNITLNRARIPPRLREHIQETLDTLPLSVEPCIQEGRHFLRRFFNRPVLFLVLDTSAHSQGMDLYLIPTTRVDYAGFFNLSPYAYSVHRHGRRTPADNPFIVIEQVNHPPSPEHPTIWLYTEPHFPTHEIATNPSKHY